MKCDNELLDFVGEYKKNREFVKLSIPVSLKGNTYREVVFERSFFFKRKRLDINGVLFIDKLNNIVRDKSIVRELSELFLNLEQLLEDSFINGLEKSILSDNDLLEEERKYRNINKIMQVLIEKNTPGAEKIDGIIKRLPQYKKENNILIKQYLDIVKTIKVNDGINSDFLMNDIKQIYNLTLIKNFEKIKFISTGRNYYEFIKKEAVGLYKKKTIGMMGSNVNSNAANVEYVFNHLIQVVDVYNRILDMSQSDYIKYLNNIEKQDIHLLIEKNRAL